MTLFTVLSIDVWLVMTVAHYTFSMRPVFFLDQWRQEWIRDACACTCEHSWFNTMFTCMYQIRVQSTCTHSWPIPVNRCTPYGGISEHFLSSAIRGLDLIIFCGGKCTLLTKIYICHPPQGDFNFVNNHQTNYTHLVQRQLMNHQIMVRHNKIITRQLIWSKLPTRLN